MSITIVMKKAIDIFFYFMPWNIKIALSSYAKEIMKNDHVLPCASYVLKLGKKIVIPDSGQKVVFRCEYIHFTPIGLCKKCYYF